MQIVDTTTGDVVEYEPGLSVEINFVYDCVQRALSKGVGLFRGKKHVAKDLQAAIEETIFELKSKVKPHYHVN